MPTYDVGAVTYIGSVSEITDHGALTGLGDDDHTQYLLKSNANGPGLVYAANVLGVGQGPGLTVNADDVGLTTPGTLTASSTNSASGSHTHAITASSNPGVAASLLKTDAAGKLTLASLGVTGAATVGTTLGVTGATTLGSTLGVTGAATLNSTLAVTGAASFFSDSIRISRTAPINGVGIFTTSAGGWSRAYGYFNGALDLGGYGASGDAPGVLNYLWLGDSYTAPTLRLYSGTAATPKRAQFLGPVVMDTTLGVTGATTLSSTLGVTGAATLNSTLAVTGATTLNSTVSAAGTLTLGSTITGAVQATRIKTRVALTIADDGYVLLGVLPDVGMGIILCASEPSFCLFAYSGTTVTIISDPGSVYGTTVDVDNKHNIVGYNGTTLLLQNKRGAQHTYSVHLFGAATSF